MTTTDSTPGDGDRTASSTWTWLLPVLTFLVGCLLGGVVVGAGAFGGDEQQAAAPEATASPDAGADPDPSPGADDLVVRVPESCLEAADGATEATGQVDEVVTAVRDLDARRLQEIVDRIQRVQPEVQRLAEQCRSVAGQRLQDGQLATSAPVPTASP